MDGRWYILSSIDSLISTVSNEKKMSTYTDKDVPITMTASALDRSCSSDLVTLSTNFSPKNVIPGFNTPLHGGPITGSDSLSFDFLALLVPVVDGRLRFGRLRVHLGTFPAKISLLTWSAETFAPHI